MTDEPTTKTQSTPVRNQGSRTQIGGSSSSGNRSPSLSPGSTLGDPTRHEFGDKTDEDAGEGHKGPAVDATKTPSSDRKPNARTIFSNQRNQPSSKTTQANVQSHPGSDCSSSGKSSDSKSTSNQSGGDAAV